MQGVTAPAGWYPDSTGAPRWWDGERWGESYVVRNESPASVAPGTRADTLWVWLVVALSVLALGAMFVYLFEVAQRVIGFTESLATGGEEVPPVESLALQIFLGPWALISTVVGWLAYGLCVWFAVLDVRELTQRGFWRPFHWAWVLIGWAVYVIGRHIVIRRRGGRGSGPLTVTIITLVAVIIASVIWDVAIVLHVLRTQTLSPLP